MADTPGAPQSRRDVATTWRLTLQLLGRRPLVALLFVPMISFAAYAVVRLGFFVPVIPESSPFLWPYSHLIMIVREGAVCLVAALFAWPLMQTAGLVPERSQGRSLPAFAGRTAIAVLVTIGLTEIFVPPTDLASAAIGVGVDGEAGGSAVISLFWELAGLIVLRAVLATASLVSVPDALLGHPRTRLQGEGRHLFLACLLSFGVAGCAQAGIWLIAPNAITLLRILCLALVLDATAMLFAILLAFVTHSRFAPNAAAAKVAATFD